jgi:MSHA biogenesis protein MshL
MTRTHTPHTPLISPTTWPRLLALVCTTLLVGCADRFPLRGQQTPVDRLNAEMALAQTSARGNATARAAQASAAASEPVAAAAETPAAPVVPPKPVMPAEQRFDLVVNGAAARDVFLSMVSDTRYSMLMHPGVSGTLSVTLRGVTVREALESIRDVYGYDYKFEGRRITVYPPSMQTRIFSINYLNTKRQGRSDVRVSGGSAPSNNDENNGLNNSGNNSTANNNSGNNNNNNNNNRNQAPDSSQISTSSTTDFWTETTDALRSMVGNAGGRAVISSPQSGTIAVRAMPDELRQVEAFLRASRLSIERQVMLEAKIIEVELSQGFQSGIDWSVLKKRSLIGQTSGYAGNPLLGNAKGFPTLGTSDGSSLLADSVSLPTGAAGTIGLSLSTNGFQAVMGFLESHGDLQILSSPRVATLNNQKAVLKVGTDEYFVTNVSGGSINANNNNVNNNTTTLPSLTLTPFFSGIALDVTPQIDEADTITLHIHPSVTSVTEKTKQIDLGTIGKYRLPLASSNVNETDTVVRVLDGNIVAIGGLMQMQGSRQNSGLPGSADNVITRTLFGNNANSSRKKELVVLIRPTIIRSAEDWAETTRQNTATLEDMNSGTRRVITVEGIKPADAKP